MNMTYVFRKPTALTAYWSEDGMLTNGAHAFIGVICLVDVADIAMAAPITQQIALGNLAYDAQSQGQVPNDGAGGEGASFFHAEAFVHGLPKESTK